MPDATTPPTPAEGAKVVRTRTSTVSYPYTHLSLALEVAKAVKAVGGNSEVSRSLLAQQIKVDEQSSDYAQKLASCKTFGLLEGKSAFKVTELARGIFSPNHDPVQERKLALLRALNTPGAFMELIVRYDGTRLPPIEIISNVLHDQFGIPGSWKVRIATFFIKSAEFAGAIVDGFLRFKSELEKSALQGNGNVGGGRDEGSGGSPEGTGAGKPEDNFNRNGKGGEGIRDIPPGTNVWQHVFDGQHLRLETPEGLTLAAWSKLEKYLQVIKPDI